MRKRTIHKAAAALTALALCAGVLTGWRCRKQHHCFQHGRICCQQRGFRRGG